MLNDRSTDNSAEVVASVMPEARVIETDYGNAAAARNKGASEASGELLAFLDADNVWYPWHLEQAKRTLLESGDAVYMSYPGQSPDALQSEGVGVTAPFESIATGLGINDFLKLRFRRGFGFPTTGQVHRVDVFRAIGGFDESQVRRHDFELFMRAAKEGRWSFHPKRSWWSRPPRPGDISHDTVACQYYACRAYIINRMRHNSRLMRRVIRKHSFMAIREACLSGDPSAVSEAMELCSKHTSLVDRVRLWYVRRNC